jgi:integrase
MVSYPFTTKVLWSACQQAAQLAGPEHKHIHPHTLRHYAEFRTMPNGFVPSWRRFGKISLDAILLCGTIRHSPVRFTGS